MLVAEDNATDRKVLARQLDLIGLAAEFADDGLAALTLWRADPGRYAMLLTDLHMPRLDGNALVAALRAEGAPDQRLPIVALTANALTGEADRCRAAGMNDYLSKPVQIERLRSTLLRWLPPAPTALATLAERRVLLVDDDPVQLALLLPMLRAEQSVAVEAFDRAEALLARLSTIDSRASLALIDLNMPGMDGIELVRHLAEIGFQGARALVSGADRRLVETAMRLAQARGLNVLGCLHKPVAATAVRALLQRWREAPPARAAAAVALRSAAEVGQAIAGDQLRLLCQPQVCLRTGALDGVEALVRWQHPQDGPLSPLCFVPVAEEHGLIDALTRMVLGLALQQARAWRDAQGLAVKVSVNVSMDHLAPLDFPEYVVAQLAHHGIPAGDLVLEVTETRLMKDLRAPLDMLARLRLRGIGLSIDDFGTGHSSLAQLRDLPFDELKIDQGFVHGGRGEPTLRVILTGSVELAQQLGMRSVAEGVEDAADRGLVRRSGCTAAQGYLFGRPMPAEALADWLLAWQAQKLALLAGALPRPAAKSRKRDRLHGSA